MKVSILALSAMFGALGSARAQTPPLPPWGLGMEDVTAIMVPPAIRSQLGDLEYDDADSIEGVSVDLDGDGARDYVIQAAPSLCGNGGCPYAIFDGATGRDLGQVAGSPLYVRAEKTHGHPIIETYSHSSAESGTMTTYKFDGRAYVVSSRHTVRGTSLDSLMVALRRIPLWRPHGPSRRDGR
jgi:hypothetical protein